MRDIILSEISDLLEKKVVEAQSFDDLMLDSINIVELGVGLSERFEVDLFAEEVQGLTINTIKDVVDLVIYAKGLVV